MDWVHCGWVDGLVLACVSERVWLARTNSRFCNLQSYVHLSHSPHATRDSHARFASPLASLLATCEGVGPEEGVEAARGTVVEFLTNSGSHLISSRPISPGPILSFLISPTSPPNHLSGGAPRTSASLLSRRRRRLPRRARRSSPRWRASLRSRAGTPWPRRWP